MCSTYGRASSGTITPPVNGHELVAEDVKFTYDHFLTEKGNANRYMLDSVDRIEVVDRNAGECGLSLDFPNKYAKLDRPMEVMKPKT